MLNHLILLTFIENVKISKINIVLVDTGFLKKNYGVSGFEKVLYGISVLRSPI